ncbi:DNA repair protein RecO [Allorhodopirellula solitaria]|uniref:DNA repair protein RecO n=1 Tax=Allorhodopirellula solitaria TaxID=2527987 RepID=A0A5C5YJT0_9BACT|nr:DNA repair protein RecO [Allorhodopirellula solitaria]TWT75069.1 DNA repair protein RecO [Allorhodopirellula solitaria]
MSTDTSRHHSTTAIVLRLVDFSETSLVVTLLTRDRGRISALAKGARRLKGPFEGSLDLLSVCRITLIAKSGDTLDLLTESKLRRRFRGGERSLGRTYAGYYIAETLRWWLDDSERHEAIFDLTLAALALIDGRGPVAETVLAFDCQCLRLLGHAPTTRSCCICGMKIEHGERETSHNVAFSVDGGGVVCAACRPRQASLVMLSHSAVQTLEELLQPLGETDDTSRQVALSEQDGVFPLSSLLPRVGETSYPALRGFVTRYMQSLMGRMLRMQPYLPTTIRSRS